MSAEQPKEAAKGKAATEIEREAGSGDEALPEEKLDTVAGGFANSDLTLDYLKGLRSGKDDP